MNQIDVENLSKKFIVYEKSKNPFLRQKKMIEAVDNITFSVEVGERIGFIGPNGAGKSTTIKMLTGILIPTSGSIKINGNDPHKQRRKFLNEIGVVFGQRSQLWWDLPVEDSFKLLKYIYHVPEKQYLDNMEMFQDILSIGDILKKPVRQMSLGQRMRCEVAAAFIHNPKIVYLDEPTIGLDIIAKENIRKFIQMLNSDKKVTVILTTHDMSDIEKLCNRILIIDKGKIIYNGDMEKIRDLKGKRRFMQIDLKDDIEIKDQRITILQKEGQREKLSFLLDEITISEVLEKILSKTEISDMELSVTPIEEIIKEIYKGSI